MQIDRFEAFRIHQSADGHRAGIETMHTDALSDGEVLVKVAYSSVNYKDALAGSGKGRILRKPELNGGIDAAGTVVASRDPAFKEGDQVLCTGSGLSETRDGGYAHYIKLDSAWAIPLPKGLSLRESMQLGTAGFTAALALLRMQHNLQQPEHGPIAITGASGGVGMLGVEIFSRAGYEVHTISGKPAQFELLRALGAKECLERSQFAATDKPLDTARYAGALDNVGGATLAALLPRIQPYGNVALCGNAGGIAFDSTVMPFIIRGVSLLGIASAGTARDLRNQVWQQLAGPWKPQQLDRIAHNEVELAQLPQIFDKMLEGGSIGRTLVRIGGN